MLFKLQDSGEVKILTIPAFEETGLVRHCFTTRIGGLSSPPYESLNLGLHVGDSPEIVIENRRRVCSKAGIDFSGLVAAQQIHGERVAVINRADQGRGTVNYLEALQGTDALITRESNVSLSIYCADCVPIFVLDPVVPAIGLVHAGWKGTVSKIGAKTILKMREEFGTKPKDCLIGIGPSIGPCCYEVDSRVADLIRTNYLNWRELVIDSFSGRWQLDLWKANRISLEEVGVLEKNIIVSEYCTGCHPDLFFSYRAEKGKTGRMAAMMSLKS